MKSSVIFKHCRAISKGVTEDEKDPFADTAALGELVSRIQGDITADEYGSADDDLCNCFTFSVER